MRYLALNMGAQGCLGNGGLFGHKPVRSSVHPGIRFLLPLSIPIPCIFFFLTGSALLYFSNEYMRTAKTTVSTPIHIENCVEYHAIREDVNSGDCTWC
jgi:hypothetical protein